MAKKHKGPEDLLSKDRLSKGDINRIREETREHWQRAWNQSKCHERIRRVFWLAEQNRWQVWSLANHIEGIPLGFSSDLIFAQQALAWLIEWNDLLWKHGRGVMDKLRSKVVKRYPDPATFGDSNSLSAVEAVGHGAQHLCVYLLREIGSADGATEEMTDAGCGMVNVWFPNPSSLSDLADNNLIANGPWGNAVEAIAALHWPNKKELDEIRLRLQAEQASTLELDDSALTQLTEISPGRRNTSPSAAETDRDAAIDYRIESLPEDYFELSKKDFAEFYARSYSTVVRDLKKADVVDSDTDPKRRAAGRRVPVKRAMRAIRDEIGIRPRLDKIKELCETLGLDIKSDTCN